MVLEFQHHLGAGFDPAEIETEAGEPIDEAILSPGLETSPDFRPLLFVVGQELGFVRGNARKEERFEQEGVKPRV